MIIQCNDYNGQSKCHHYDLIKKLLRKSLNNEKNFNKCELQKHSVNSSIKLLILCKIAH